MSVHVHAEDCFGEIDGRLMCGHPASVEDQPPPVPNARPAIVDLVVADMVERKRIGTERYGTPLQPFNGRDALVDAYQEALDLVMYLRQAIEERP